MMLQRRVIEEEQERRQYQIQKQAEFEKE
jgi:hypothetical protein